MARHLGVAAAIALAVLVAALGNGALPLAPVLHGAQQSALQSVQAMQSVDLLLTVTVLLSVAGLFVAVAASPPRIRS